MSKKKYPIDRSVLPDQKPYIQDMYKQWDELAKCMASLEVLMESLAFKRYSKEEKSLVKDQYKYSKRLFNILDGRINLSILG